MTHFCQTRFHSGLSPGDKRDLGRRPRITMSILLAVSTFAIPDHSIRRPTDITPEGSMT